MHMDLLEERIKSAQILIQSAALADFSLFFFKLGPQSLYLVTVNLKYRLNKIIRSPVGRIMENCHLNISKSIGSGNPTCALFLFYFYSSLELHFRFIACHGMNLT